jgi:hypothetical protein
MQMEYDDCYQPKKSMYTVHAAQPAVDQRMQRSDPAPLNSTQNAAARARSVAASSAMERSRGTWRDVTWRDACVCPSVRPHTTPNGEAKIDGEEDENQSHLGWKWPGTSTSDPSPNERMPVNNRAEGLQANRRLDAEGKQPYGFVDLGMKVRLWLMRGVTCTFPVKLQNNSTHES